MLPLKRKGRLYCEPLSKRIVTENYATVIGAAIRDQTLCKTAKETHNMIAVTDRPDVFKWHKLFRGSRENVEGDDNSGCLSTSKTNENVSWKIF